MTFLHSIKFKFTLWYMAILAFLLVILACGVYFNLSQTLYKNLDESLRMRADHLSSYKDIMSIVASGTFEGEVGELIAFYFYYNDELGHIAPMQLEIPLDQNLIQDVIDGKEQFSTIVYEEGKRVRVYARPFLPDPPQIRPDRFAPGPAPRPGAGLGNIVIHSAALIIARPTTDIEMALKGLLNILYIAVPLTLLLAGCGGIFLAKRVFKPVDIITQTAREISETDLSRRINVKTKDELGRLAATLNNMIERLDKAFKRQKEFTGDASHELRAPLSIIQAESTLTLNKDRSVSEYKKALEAITQEADHMTKIIEQLLILARVDSGQDHLNFEDIEINDFLQSLCTDIDVLCREKELHFIFNESDKILVRGHRRSLRSLIMNLLENAIRYTDHGGEISVSVDKKDNMVAINVKDTGIGIPEEDLPYVFERFYRVDKARSRKMGGSGLGLAISLQIAEIHGGTIEVQSIKGKGSQFIFKIPSHQIYLNGK